MTKVHACSRKIDAGTVLASLVFALAFGAIMTNLVSLRLLVCEPPPIEAAPCCSGSQRTTGQRLMALPNAGLQASTIFIISLGGRIPQIVMNVRKGGSGQLSLVTCGMNVAGCFARMFTTLVLTQVSACCNIVCPVSRQSPEQCSRVQDIINFVGTAVQTVLNGILLWQCIGTARRERSSKAQAA